jgi:hypothetical protein
MRMERRISSPYSDGDSYPCVAPLRSELGLVKSLSNISKRCLSPKLKTHALELHARKVKLQQQLKIRGSAAEEVSADLANLPAVALNDILGTMRTSS